MKVIVTIFLTLIFLVQVNAQLKDIIVETYYITNDDDNNDQLAGPIEPGSTTYRIHAVLEPNSRITKIYGDDNHELKFSSTEKFFNHATFDVEFGKDMFGTLLQNGLTILDSYVTIGQVSRLSNEGLFYALLKENDDNGSIFEGNSTNLLSNDNVKIGVPLNEADGITNSDDQVETWFASGFSDAVTGESLSIFNGLFQGNSFVTNAAFLSNMADLSFSNSENTVLLAQLTTHGDIEFVINIEVEFKENNELKKVNYVGTNEIILENEEFNPLLSFPYECGCKDPNYLEADASFACEDNSLCLTPIIFGCMDINACNYNLDANYNLEELCCYVGFCNDLDISVVCPNLEPRDFAEAFQFDIIPNPSQDIISIEFEKQSYINAHYIIFNSLGLEIKSGLLNSNGLIDINELPSGIHFINLRINGVNKTNQFVKL